MIQIDTESPEPLEDQVRREIQRVIAQGGLKRGDALPSVRQLAGDLGIHWNTVARAYRRLRDDGLLTVGRGRTVTVRGDILAGDTARVGTEDAATLLESAFTQARLRGVSFDEWRTTVEQSLDAWREAWGGAE